MDRQPLLTGDIVELRPLQTSDWDDLFAVASDKRVWEQHPAHERWQEEIFRAYFNYLLEGGGTLVAIERASGTICGSSTFSNHRKGPPAMVEIGSTFLGPQFWGKGHNHDMKRLMLRHALAQVDVVEFLIGDTNLRSRRAVEGISAVLTERTELAQLPGRTALHVIYEIDRANFASGPLAT